MIRAFLGKKKQPEFGVFIEATDGTLYQSTEWKGTKTANSIVVKQPTVSFRISLTEAGDTMKLLDSSTRRLSLYMTAIPDEASAIKDMKSTANTLNIKKLVSSTDYAAGYCNAKTFPDGKTKGVLPAYGWWRIAYDNKDSVDACLSACNGTPMDTSLYYWSSTFWGLFNNRSDCWAISWADPSPYSIQADVYFYVRPFAEYN